jgi:hypothetical protein
MLCRCRDKRLHLLTLDPSPPRCARWRGELIFFVSRYVTYWVIDF